MTKRFFLWRFVFQIGWARSGLWHCMTNKGYKVVHLLALQTVSIRNLTALQFFLGPINLMAGYASPAPGMGADCCKDPSQCWEPCGELGHSAEHAREAPRSMDPVLQAAQDRMMKDMAGMGIAVTNISVRDMADEHRQHHDIAGYPIHEGDIVRVVCTSRQGAVHKLGGLVFVVFNYAEWLSGDQELEDGKFAEWIEESNLRVIARANQQQKKEPA